MNGTDEVGAELDIAPGSEVRLRTTDRGWRWICDCCPPEGRPCQTEVTEARVEYVCTLTLRDALSTREDYTILWMAGFLTEGKDGEVAIASDVDPDAIYVHHGETYADEGEDSELVFFGDEEITMFKTFPVAGPDPHHPSFLDAQAS